MKTIRLLLLMTLGSLAMPTSVGAFYNPSTGRWLSRDPIGERGGLNNHSFVGNRPVGGTDALGLRPNDPPIIIGPPSLPRYGTCGCKCVAVAVTPGPLTLNVHRPTIDLGVAVPITIGVIGNPAFCKCKQTEFGTQKMGYPSLREEAFGQVVDIPCRTYTDLPGINESYPSNWPGREIYYLNLDFDIAVSCEGTDMKLISSSAKVRGEFWRRITFNENGTASMEAIPPQPRPQ